MHIQVMRHFDLYNTYYYDIFSSSLVFFLSLSQRHAEHQLGPEDNTSAGSSAQTTPSSGLNIMFRPSPLSIAASNLGIT